ncbi:hypothetical protein BC828DRAFT_429494 [Blastocladiella britannica]|nr:hypothetical protein BC828DRAFT_429494 [Blastocladiella britannica]
MLWSHAHFGDVEQYNSYTDPRGNLRIRGGFSVFASKDQELEANKIISETFSVPSATTRTLTISVYLSESGAPKTIREPGCRLLGDIDIPVTPGEEYWNYDVEFSVLRALEQISACLVFESSTTFPTRTFLDANVVDQDQNDFPPNGAAAVSWPFPGAVFVIVVLVGCAIPSKAMGQTCEPCCWLRRERVKDDRDCERVECSIVQMQRARSDLPVPFGRSRMEKKYRRPWAASKLVYAGFQDEFALGRSYSFQSA